MEQELNFIDALLIILSLTPILTENIIETVAEEAVTAFSDKRGRNYESYLRRLNTLRHLARRLIQENPEEEAPPRNEH